MKKLTAIALTSVLCVAIISSCTSCSKDKDAPVLGAKIEVTVKNWPGSTRKDVSVYMYKDEKVTEKTKVSDAKKVVVTNDKGVATFDLNFTELNILESQTTLYFAVFYKGVGDIELVAGSVGVTVKRGETKNVDLTIPL